MNIQPRFPLLRQSLMALALCLATGSVRGDALPAMQNLVAANNAFAFTLLNQIVQAQPQGNTFISPFSVSSALQMVGNGAAGQTKTEIRQTLQTANLPDADLNAAFKSLNAQLANRSDVTLNLANGLWIQQGFEIKSTFIELNQRFFQAGLTSVDFSQPASAQAINDWADQHTRGKIKNVVQFPFPPLTRLILANAIYFKGTWEQPFKKNLTRPREFHTSSGDAKLTPMMTQDGDFAYQENQAFQAVKLPYRGGLHMELYLPSNHPGRETLLGAFAYNAHYQTATAAAFRYRSGSITVPKFKMEYQISLNEPLQALGMKSAFTSSADFSGIAAEKLSISEVKQKSFVEVNEQGTEAAAVTTVAVEAAAIRRPPPDRFNLVLDRSFLFFIADDSGSILFAGVINNPEPGD